MSALSTDLLRDPLPEFERFTVWGAGWTGVCAANFLRRFGKTVSLTDTRSPEALGLALEGLAKNHQTCLDPGVRVVHGQHQPLDGQAIVLTQSVKPTDREVLEALTLGLMVISEAELVSRSIEGSPISLVVIGGTDGKTTTVKLAGQLVMDQRSHAIIGGNSWTPLTGVALDLERSLQSVTLSPDDLPVIVGEISAFQLPSWHGFRPQVAAVTNIAEDHVQEFFQGSMAAYIAAKRAICERLQSGDFAVLNVDDPIVRAWEPELVQRGVKVVRVSLTSRAVGDHPWAAFRCNGELRLRWDGRERSVSPQELIPIKGDHNIENILTALALVSPLGLSHDVMLQSLLSFQTPHHRLEPVANWRGVEIVDDSKATNTHAAMAGLSAFGARELVVIVGGVDKGLELDAWVESLSTRARVIIVIGELRDRLMSQFAERLPQAIAAESLAQATALALEEAKPGEVLLLSPACSSFDMFSSYADRGRQFQQEIHKLIGAPDTQDL